MKIFFKMYVTMKLTNDTVYEVLVLVVNEYNTGILSS